MDMMAAYSMNRSDIIKSGHYEVYICENCTL